MNNFINVRLEAYNHNKTLNAIKHNIRHIQSKSQKLNFDNMSKDLEHNKNNYFIFDGVPYPMKKTNLTQKSITIIYHKSIKITEMNTINYIRLQMLIIHL